MRASLVTLALAAGLVAGCSASPSATPRSPGPTAIPAASSAAATDTPSPTAESTAAPTPVPTPVVRAIMDLIADPMVAADVLAEGATGAEGTCKAELGRENRSQRALEQEGACLAWIATAWIAYIREYNSAGTPDEVFDRAKVAYATTIAVLGAGRRASLDQVLADQLTGRTDYQRPSPPPDLRTADQFLGETVTKPGNLYAAVRDAIVSDLPLAADDLGLPGWPNRVDPGGIEVNGYTTVDRCLRGDPTIPGDADEQERNCANVVDWGWRAYRQSGNKKWYGAALAAYRSGYQIARTACPPGVLGSGCPNEYKGLVRGLLARAP